MPKPNPTKKRRWPFLFNLLNREGRDLLFLRAKEGEAGRWGLHMDLDNSEPESVLIFVRTDISADKIVHEVQKSLTYWREQTEPLHDGNEEVQGGKEENP